MEKPKSVKFSIVKVKEDNKLYSEWQVIEDYRPSANQWWVVGTFLTQKHALIFKNALTKAKS